VRRVRQRRKIVGEVLLGLPLLAAVVLVAGRVGATARFVTWPVVAGVLVGLGTLAVGARGIAAGTAMTVAATMVLFVVIQGPAVKCGEASVASSSGPWWLSSPSSSSASGTGAPGGRFSGTTQIGDHHYAYSCAEGRLTRFERAD
jgi:hypothetical protein